jgi:hypothetical protein
MTFPEWNMPSDPRAAREWLQVTAADLKTADKATIARFINYVTQNLAQFAHDNDKECLLKALRAAQAEAIRTASAPSPVKP